MKKALPRILILAVMSLFVNLTMAQTFNYPIKGKPGFVLTEKTRDGLHINYNLGQMTLSSLNYRGEEMTEISISSISLPNAAGCPNLPVESRMMAIPQGATATLNVVSFETETLHNVNLAPTLRIQAENEEPDMNYVKDMNVYGKNAFYPENPFVMGETYIRGVETVTVAITPFQYNPVTKDLIVYTNVELSVEFEGGNGHFGDDRLRSPYWDPILAAELLNYDQLPVIDYAARMQQWLRDDADGAEYLIITPNNDAWAEYANQLRDYRRRQGIITEVYRLDKMPANSTDQMKAWFHNAYNTWEIAPVAVCLLGDHGTNMGQYIPAESVYHSQSYGNCITDNQYADVSGDNLPDMVFSRLVAETPEQLPVLVGKQIEYEYTNPNMDASFYASPITALGWQNERWFQICSEVFGGYMRNHGYNPQRINCIYSGTPGNSWSSAQNTSVVVNYFGPNGMNYIPNSPSELGGWTGGTPEQVVNAVNQGTFWVQHRDHGLDEGWGEPAVRNPHIDQMNNVGKLPFVMSINCQTGMFNYTGSNGNCFTEKWMRRVYNGENAGAVGVLSPTQVSYSFVNDAFVWGVYDLFDGNFMPDYGPYADNTDNWMPAFGNVAGKYFLAQSTWPYNPESKNITYTMFTAHCDAFLRIYTQVPQTMEVIHPEIVLAGLGEVTITAPEGCMISLVKENGESGWDILAVVEATGDPQVITFEPQVPPTEINLIVTGQNYLRYEAVMSVIPAEGPYIVFDSKVIHDENGNEKLDFGEVINMDVTMKNVGSENMDAFEATLETTSEFITITNATAQYGSLDPNATQTVDDAFSFTVADNVPDNTNNLFTITVTNGDDIFVSNLSMKAYAPVFKLGSMSITEIDGNGNGRLDPGETALLNYVFENKGHADAALTTVTLNLLSPYLLITNPEVTFNSIIAGDTETASFEVSVNENTPSGYSCPIQITVNSGQYNTQKDYVAKVGLVIEDFESGTLGSGWTNDATAPWRVVTEDPYEGQYCVRSGNIGNNSTTTLILTHQAGSNDSISFYYKVSSEATYDKLSFYIDNQVKNNWSGTVGWTKAAYPVTAGNHNYKWTYSKDQSQTGGSDCAWIDFVTLPADRIMAGTAGYDVTICDGDDAQIVGYAIHYDDLQWTTSGDGTFDDATIPMPIYTPGAQDLANRQVTLTITISGSHGATITDEMTVFIVDRVVIENALVDVHYCATDEPQPVAVTVSGDYLTFSWLTDGDGTFDDASAFETTYTPGLNDIVNGVHLTAFAVSPGCGSINYDYPFEMNSMPSFSMGIIPPCVFSYCQGQDIDLTELTEFSGFIDGQMTIIINDETYPVLEGQPFLVPTSSFEPGAQSLHFQHLSNGLCETDLDSWFSFNIMEAPNLTVDETNYAICLGESANIVLHATGGDPNHPEAFSCTVSGEGFEPFVITSESYTLTLTPTESTEIHLTEIVMENPDCGSDCTTELDITINISIEEHVDLPIINGPDELDVYLTPTSTYTVSNDVMVAFGIEPEEAATLLPANDGKSVVVNWSANYKGAAVLTATPISPCNDGNGTLNINVKNSTDVNEYGAKASIYPNPTDGNITVEAEGMQRLTVINELGQVVYDIETGDDTESINMSQFGAGIYVIRIHTENGVSVKRVTVVR